MKGWRRLIVILGVCFTLAACNGALSSVSNKVEHPLPTKVVSRMKAYDMTEHSPIMMRIFKEESVLEVWKARSNGRYEKIAEYDICKWSGELGPKRQEGDRQAPEGFYSVSRHQMNPNSSYYLSFNLGYPNRFDRSHGRTGSNLMVHGACSSAGCYSMSDENVLEIYAFAREAFRGGQEAFQVQALPFRMTAENMARHRDNPNYEFWKMLKIGYDHFELTRTPPKVNVCDQSYVFNQVAKEEDAVFDPNAACPQMMTPPSLQVAYASYVQDYEEAFDEALRKQSRKASGGPLSALFPRAMTPADKATVPAFDAASKPVQQNVTAEPAGLSPASPSSPALVQPDPAQMPRATAAQPGAAPATSDGAVPAPTTVPVPRANPLESAALYAPVAAPTPPKPDKPFWKLWSRN